MREDLNSIRSDVSDLTEAASHMSQEFDNFKIKTEICTCKDGNCDENSVPAPPPTNPCGTGDWRPAVDLNMTDPNTTCPYGWTLTEYPQRSCGRAKSGGAICDSITFPVSGGEYSHVCGRIKAYQWGWIDAFYGYNQGYATIDEAYFSGVAVMHGNPRQHIWTFAAGLKENDPNYYYGSTYGTLCPCDAAYSVPIPSFVGDNYFCESGYINTGLTTAELSNIDGDLYTLHSNDTLWDGMDCHTSSDCCSMNNPPYFIKTLNTPTTDDIELRMCHYWSSYWENLAVELVEIYVI